MPIRDELLQKIELCYETISAISHLSSKSRVLYKPFGRLPAHLINISASPVLINVTDTPAVNKTSQSRMPTRRWANQLLEITANSEIFIPPNSDLGADPRGWFLAEYSGGEV